MAIMLDGKKYAASVFEKLKEIVSKLDYKPGLAVIQVGDNPASSVYVRNKEKKANEIGFKSVMIKLPTNTSADMLYKEISDLNDDDSIHAILLQLPLPEHLDETYFLDKIDPGKDVDGFHPLNTGLLASGQTPHAIPCTPLGIIKLLKSYNIQIEGKRAVVIGRSNIVGKPIYQLLLKENATVTHTHSKTKNLAEITREADIIVSAVGREKLLTADMVKKGAIIVDVGIIRNAQGKLAGDVDFINVEPLAQYITPVPGGVGPVTIATLMENTLELYEKLYKRQNENDKQQSKNSK